jgi:recombination protein RecR
MPLYPKPLFQLIQLLKKLPGVGQKSAERYAFQLLEWKPAELKQLGFQLSQLKELISSCTECGALKEFNCSYCSNESRSNGTLCIVSNPKDIFAIEETKIFNGLYYVLPHLLTPFEEHFEEQVNLKGILSFIEKNKVKEIILALESTLEGDATALFLKEKLHTEGLNLSRLAHGIPLGSTLEFIDGGTLSKALMGRQSF